jgi:anti-sigma B factor antagonist
MPAVKSCSDGEVLVITYNEARILDEMVIQQIQEELLAILRGTWETSIVVDFRNVRFLASAALGVLVRVNKKVKEAKRTMKLCNLSPENRQVFKVTGLEKIFEIFDDLDTAKASFKKKGLFFWK